MIETKMAGQEKMIRHRRRVLPKKGINEPSSVILS